MFWLLVVIVVFALAFVAGYQIGYHDGWVETLPVSVPNEPVLPSPLVPTYSSPEYAQAVHDRREWEKRHGG